MGTSECYFLNYLGGELRRRERSWPVHGFLQRVFSPGGAQNSTMTLRLIHHCNSHVSLKCHGHMCWGGICPWARMRKKFAKRVWKIRNMPRRDTGTAFFLSLNAPLLSRAARIVYCSPLLSQRWLTLSPASRHGVKWNGWCSERLGAVSPPKVPHFAREKVGEILSEGKIAD